MARKPRLKVEGVEAWYHVRGQVAGSKTDFLLAHEGCQIMLMNIIKFYEKAYFCDVASYSIMGTHYHLIIKFLPFKNHSIATLKKRAYFIYPNRTKEVDKWTQEQWTTFSHRMFNLSEFMRNIQSGFARWYNKTFERSGRFWADRFKSSILVDNQALLDCMLYVDLNPVRAGMVKRPELYTGSSIYARQNNQDAWLMPLNKLMPINDIDDNIDNSPEKLLHDYRSMLYYRGSIPTKKGQTKISKELLNQELNRGFKKPGKYLKKLRYFIDGILIGDQKNIEKIMTKLTKINNHLKEKISKTIEDSKHQCLHIPRDVES